MRSAAFKLSPMRTEAGAKEHEGEEKPSLAAMHRKEGKLREGKDAMRTQD